MAAISQLIAIQALTALSLMGSEASICISDRVGVGSAALRVFHAELNQLVASTVTEKPARCIEVTIRATPPSRYPSALGLTWRAGDRILPSIEIYTRTITALLESDLHAAALGRALAKVLAHELTHYVRQREDHESEGVLRASFRGSEFSASGTQPPASSRR